MKFNKTVTFEIKVSKTRSSTTFIAHEKKTLNKINNLNF